MQTLLNHLVTDIANLRPVCMQRKAPKPTLRKPVLLQAPYPASRAPRSHHHGRLARPRPGSAPGRTRVSEQAGSPLPDVRAAAEEGLLLYPRKTEIPRHSGKELTALRPLRRGRAAPHRQPHPLTGQSTPRGPAPTVPPWRFPWKLRLHSEFREAGL